MIFLVKKCPLFYQKDIYEIIKCFCPEALIGMEGQGNSQIYSGLNTYQLLCKHEVNDVYISTQLEVMQGMQVIYKRSENNERSSNDFQEKGIIKRSIVRHVYDWLNNLTNKELKWGIVTGVRPVQMARNYLKKNDIPKTLSYLMSQFLMSKEKALKLIKTAKYQMALTSSSTQRVSLYVHIPFCNSKCAYCSFGTTVWKNTPLKQRDYVKAIIKELEYINLVLSENNLIVDTIYIGGGTPTALDVTNLKTLLSYLSKRFNTFTEFTVEAGRPDTISKQKMIDLKEAGVTRLSINPQTMVDRTLKAVGRNHTMAQFLSAYYLAREVGFNNINCDLIYGLPDESKREMLCSINEVLKLKPESITIHALSIKKGAEYALKNISYRNQTEVEECITLTDQLLEEKQYLPYYLYRQKKMLGSTENTGYCLKGKECKYNIYMMEGLQTILSVGAGAITRLKTNDLKNKIVRVPNIKDPNQYVSKIDNIILDKAQSIKNARWLER